MLSPQPQAPTLKSSVAISTMSLNHDPIGARTGSFGGIGVPRPPPSSLLGRRLSRDREDASHHESVVEVGTPRHPTPWSSTSVRYHDFPRLPSSKGESSSDSPPFRAHGLEWYLRMHPGGAASASGEGMVSLYLRCILSRRCS